MLAPAPGQNVKIRWRDRQVRTEAERKLVRRLRVAGSKLTEIIRANIGVPGPPHSSPGQYPRRISGRLQSGVSVRVIGMDVQVVTKAPYARHIERIRPFMRRTLDENRRLIIRTIQQTR